MTTKTTKKSAMLQAIETYCKLRGYPVPVGEHRFHEHRKWRWDVSWPAKKLAVEIHGAVWVKGRHTSGIGFSNDQEKFATAAVMGWRMIPVTTQQFKAGELWKLLDMEFQGNELLQRK